MPSDGRGEIEIFPTVKVGQKTAQVLISGLVPDEKHGAMTFGDSFGSDDRFDPRFQRTLDKVRYAVQAVTVRQRHAADTHLPGCKAQLLRMVKPPGWGKGGVNVEGDERRHLKSHISNLKYNWSHLLTISITFEVVVSEI